MKLRRALGVAATLLVGIGVSYCGSKGTTGTQTPPVEEPRDSSPNSGQVDGKPDGGSASNSGKEETSTPPPPQIVHNFVNYTTANRLPTTVRDVAGDGSGNVWVAGYDGLYLLRHGQNGFEKFTEAQGLQQWKVISVAGLSPNEVVVGYEGVFGGKEDNDPDWMKKSGGWDRLKLEGGILDGTHYVIFTPPNMICGGPSEDEVCRDGRYKLRNIYTIRPELSGPYAGDIWFGGNHGVAMWNASKQAIIEHQHAAINGYNSEGVYGFMTGDYFGLAIDNNHNIWIGGAHRVARIPYATDKGEFNAAVDPVLDVWPDGADEHDRSHDDNVKALTVDTSNNVWIGSLTNDLARYNQATKKIDYFDKSKGAPDKSVTALAADPDGTIWVGSYVGIGRYNPNTNTWVYYYHRTDGLPDDSITSIQIDTRTTPRTVYIGTVGGVSVYQGP